MKKLVLAMTVLSLFGLSVSCNRGGDGADKGNSPATGTDSQMEQDQSSRPMDQGSQAPAGDTSAAPANTAQ